MNALLVSLTMFGDRWWFYVVHSSWQSALLASAVLLLTIRLRRRAPSLCYALLLIALLKFAVPPVLAFPTGLFSHAAVWAETGIGLPAAAAPASREVRADVPVGLPETSGSDPVMSAPVIAATGQPEVQTRTAAEARPARTHPIRPFLQSWRLVLLGVHVLGVFAMTVWIISSWLGLRRIMRRCRPVEAGTLWDAFSRLSEQLRLRRKVRLLVGPDSVPPMGFGVLRPAVVLPESLLGVLSEEERHVVMAHELAHHRRKDTWWIVVENTLLLVWWFNPVLWLLVRELRRTREDCCDDLVLASGVTSNDRYCDSLMRIAYSVASPRPAHAALGFADHLHPLGRRMKRIMDTTLRRSATLSVAGMLIVLGVSLAVLPGLRIAKAQPSTPAVPGPSGKVLRLDGVDDYIHWPYAKQLDLTANFTLAAWANVARDSGEGCILFHGDGHIGADPYQLVVRNGNMQSNVDGGAGGVRAVVSHPVGKGWHHWTAVSDASANKLLLYMDGEKVDEKELPGSCEYDTSQMYTEVGSIDGGTWGGTWGFFKGLIDDVAILNVPLSPEQVKSAYENGLTGSEPGLVGLWRFDEDGQTVHDASLFKFDIPLGSDPGPDQSDPERVAADAASGAEAAPPESVPAPSAVEANGSSGKTIFKGRYHHVSRGRGIDEPSELLIKQTADGGLVAVASLPFMKWNAEAVGNLENRLVRYASASSGRGDEGGYSMSIDMQDGTAFLTVRSPNWDVEKKEFNFVPGAQFDPNTRPDAYLAANILLRGFALKAGESKEVDVFDVDNAGTGLVAYKIKVENVGKEEVSVPAGVFMADHIVLTQLTSADTWFKKRAGHVTDFWALDNGVIVRVLRHREPYEMQLLDWQTPEKLPGQLEEASAPVGSVRLSILSAVYGAGDKWVDVTKQLNDRIADNTLNIRVSNDIAGDPVYGVSKKLNVHYQVGDKVFVTSADESEMLRLP